MQTSTAPLMIGRRAALGLAGATIAAATLRAVPAFAATGWAEVDALAQKFVADRFSPGVAITAVRNGQTIHSRGYGLANLETGTATTPQSVFRIGSITKQFTGAALVLLQADGKLSLDDCLARFLPGFPGATEVTLRQMANHTSGYGNYTNQPDPKELLVLARKDYDSVAIQRLMAEGTRPLFLFEPGTDWAYSNTAFLLLGEVITKVTGAPYGEFFKKRLFEPAGMVATSVDDVADVVPNRANGYSVREGSETEFSNAAFMSMTVPGAAGNMRSTTEDLCRWHAALLGGKVLPPAGLKQFLTPARLKNGSQPMAVTEPNKPKAPLDYGLGVFMRSFEGRKTVEHGGGIPGFLSDVRSFPAEGATVSILTNSDAGARKGYMEASKALGAAVNRAALGI
jgi:CubicO group peptidase (beta-lactamase class C family)